MDRTARLRTALSALTLAAPLSLSGCATTTLSRTLPPTLYQPYKHAAATGIDRTARQQLVGATLAVLRERGAIGLKDDDGEIVAFIDNQIDSRDRVAVTISPTGDLLVDVRTQLHVDQGWKNPLFACGSYSHAREKELVERILEVEGDRRMVASASTATAPDALDDDDPHEAALAAQR